MINNTIVECQDPSTREQHVVIASKDDGVEDNTGNPVTLHNLKEDKTVEMNPMVSKGDKDDFSVTTQDTTSAVVQPPNTSDSNFVTESVPDVIMAEHLHRFSNHHKRGSCLNLPLDTYNKRILNKEITFFQPRSMSFMTV